MSVEKQTQPSTSFDRCAAAIQQDDELRRALDAFAAEIAESIADFCMREIALLQRLGFKPEESEAVLSMVMGWLLGVHTEDYIETAQRLKNLNDRLQIAAFAAGFSSRSYADMDRRSTH